MPKFAPKSVVVEAHRWFYNGDHPDDYTKTHQGLENGELREFSPAHRKEQGWEGDVVRYFRHPDFPGEGKCFVCYKKYHYHGWIDQPDGLSHNVCPGDWVLKEVGEKHYTVLPDAVFTHRYEQIRER